MSDSFSVLPPAFYRRSTEKVAADLLGRLVVRELGEDRAVLRIVETEAYLGAPDRASHAWGGRRTPRNESLYLEPGHAYVYQIYGLHHCLNVVTGVDHPGAAVLIRAGEPVEGTEGMIARRGLRRALRRGDLAGGPGKLCQALAIDRRQDGVLLASAELRLTAGAPTDPEEVATGPRIGIDYAGEAAGWPLRFAVRDHPEVSRPRLR